MKKIIASIVIAASLFASSQVLLAKERNFDPDRIIEHMTNKLDLTKAQQSAIKTVIVEEHQKRMELLESRHAEIDSLLTDEQKELSEQMREEKKQKKRSFRKECDKK
jgi:Spy/CpxP family protein refolding chaperone